MWITGEWLNCANFNCTLSLPSVTRSLSFSPPPPLFHPVAAIPRTLYRSWCYFLTFVYHCIFTCFYNAHHLPLSSFGLPFTDPSSVLFGWQNSRRDIIYDARVPEITTREYRRCTRLDNPGRCLAISDWEIFARNWGKQILNCEK